jgi:hypothetical protein
MNWLELAGPKHISSAITKNGNGGLELFALTEEGDIHHCRQTQPGDPASWSTWSSLGKGGWNVTIPKSFALGLSHNGGVEVFLVADCNATDGRGQIFHNMQIDGDERAWSGWHVLDAAQTSGWSTTVCPSVVRNSDGFLDLFVMFADRRLHGGYWWSDYTNSTPVGHFRQSPDGRWSGPDIRTYIETCISEEVGDDYCCNSQLPVKLVAALNSTGRLELFANAGDFEAKRGRSPDLSHIPANVWHSWQGNAPVRRWWSGNFPMPDVEPNAASAKYHIDATQPIVALDHDGSLEIFLGGTTDGEIWVKKQDPVVSNGWSSWLKIGSSKGWRRPIVTNNQGNTLTVFASSL